MQPGNASELTLVGRILLWGVRHWVARRRCGRDLPGYVIHTFERAPLTPALLRELESLMAQLTVAARRRLRVGPPGDPRLTPDEATLLLAMQAATLGVDDVCRLLSAELVTGSGLRSVALALDGVGGELRAATPWLLPAERYRITALDAPARRAPVGASLPRSSPDSS